MKYNPIPFVFVLDPVLCCFHFLVQTLRVKGHWPSAKYEGLKWAIGLKAVCWYPIQLAPLLEMYLCTSTKLSAILSLWTPGIFLSGFILNQCRKYHKIIVDITIYRDSLSLPILSPEKITIFLKFQNIGISKYCDILAKYC